VRDLPTSGSGKKASDPKERAKQAAKTRKMAPDEKAAYKKEKAKKALIATMGIDPENDWKARYEVLPNKEKVVAELRRLADDADEIYLATDLDREGEAIAWHLKEVIGGDESRFKRVVFNEITKTAIQEAFERPGKLDQNCVNAQQARRFAWLGHGCAASAPCLQLISRLQLQAPNTPPASGRQQTRPGPRTHLRPEARASQPQTWPSAPAGRSGSGSGCQCHLPRSSCLGLRPAQHRLRRTRPWLPDKHQPTPCPFQLSARPVRGKQMRLSSNTSSSQNNL